MLVRANKEREKLLGEKVVTEVVSFFEVLVLTYLKLLTVDSFKIPIFWIEVLRRIVRKFCFYGIEVYVPTDFQVLVSENTQRA